jgi:transposase-like protein
MDAENWTGGKGGKANLVDVESSEGMTRRLLLRGMRRRYDGAFKAWVALEAIRGERTVAAIAAAYGVPPNQISTWKRQALDELPKIFSVRYEKKAVQGKELIDMLMQRLI